VLLLSHSLRARQYARLITGHDHHRTVWVCVCVCVCAG
jgi:hypothetical protein